MIQLANKKFSLVSESNVHDVGTKTLLTVNQEGELIFGEYTGGKVVKGSFIAKLSPKNTFERYFHHYNDSGRLVSGKSLGSIEILRDGRVRLKESWDLDSHFSGNAIYDEVDEKGIENEFYYNLSVNK